VQPGTRLGPYEIVAPLGAGGMGEVYRARDTRLGREVAVKLLRAEVAGDAERVRRFEQEARAVAALSHPNILALYDVGTHEGRSFLVTELLEGQTLGERISSGGLTVAKSVELATQIAKGLAAAHERGIVHRDLKPSNVFITRDGVVKILDFGLARLTQVGGGGFDQEMSPTETALTGVGAVLGTVGYMAPEQVRGLPADHRSDIFSFGCALYEMLAGKAPFRRDTAVGTAAAILNEEPPRLASAVKPVPPRLAAIVTRCLEKRPEDRFQSARDLAHDLGAVLAEAKPATESPATGARTRWGAIGLALAAIVVLGVAGWLVFKARAPETKAPGVTPPKIIVLPFENLGLPEDSYFAAGMTEEITSRLANVQGLGVISRTTAVQYDRTGKTVRQIGEDLAVDYVLEGTVRWEHGEGRESRVRITPQLIRVADDTHVWADRYDRLLVDVFAMQSEVAEAAVKAMGVALLPRERTALREISTNDLEAYDLYLRGRELDARGLAKSDVEAAVRMYQAAVDRDPRFAQAFAGLARTSLLMSWIHNDRSQDWVARARNAAERAVELRPDLAETRIALGYYYYHGLLSYPQALDEFEAALEIQPNNGDALRGTGFILMRQGRWQESADIHHKVTELDEKDASRFYSLGFASVPARRYADADRAFERARALNPRYAGSYVESCWLQLAWHGDVAQAQAILDEAARVPGLEDPSGSLQKIRVWLALARRDDQEALRLLQSEPRDAFDSQSAHVPVASLRGQVQRLAGQEDLARRSFEAARLELEQKIREDPGESRFRGALGIACAGLGRTEEAVREARLGCELMPASKDAYRALYRLEELALVYTMVGRHDEAIVALDDLLGRSGEWTPHVLRLDPRWDPLRANPRFQALLTKHEVEE